MPAVSPNAQCSQDQIPHGIKARPAAAASRHLSQKLFCASLSPMPRKVWHRDARSRLPAEPAIAIARADAKSLKQAAVAKPQGQECTCPVDRSSPSSAGGAARRENSAKSTDFLRKARTIRASNRKIRAPRRHTTAPAIPRLCIVPRRTKAFLWRHLHHSRLSDRSYKLQRS